jgi:archaellum component FlaC
MQTDTDNGNIDVIDASEEIIDSLEELISMFKGGKKTRPELKNKIYRGLDDIKNAYSEIKYED